MVGFCTRVLLLAAMVPAIVAAKTDGDIYARCTACHSMQAPPLSLVYRRYLMLYSSKGRVAERMVAFLTHPTKKGSSMPEGMKSRFNPQNHPPFPLEEAKEAVGELIEREDLLKRIVIPKE
jgi:hypothetical protein